MRQQGKGNWVGLWKDPSEKKYSLPKQTKMKTWKNQKNNIKKPTNNLGVLRWRNAIKSKRNKITRIKNISIVTTPKVSARPKNV